MFIRLTGCNLRCSYCDTVYAYEGGEALSVENLIERVRSEGISLVEITGGEPLLQYETALLAQALADEGYSVLIETNGSVSIKGLDPRVVIIMDIKTPGSLMFESFRLDNLPLLKAQDEVKFVLTGREDYEWARSFVKEHALHKRCRINMSPVFGSLPPADLVRWIMEDRMDVRLNLQLHKVIYGPEERGV